MVCAGLAPIAIWPTYTLPYEAAIMPKSFLWFGLPDAANLATAPRGVALDAWPPVFEYTPVSMTSTFTSRPEAST